MQIKTRVHELKPEELIRLTISYRMRWFWPVCLGMLLIGAWHGFLWLIAFSILFPALIVAGVHHSLKSRVNRVFYVDKHYEMDDRFLHTYLEGGGMSKIAWNHFHRALRASTSSFI